MPTGYHTNPHTSGTGRLLIKMLKESTVPLSSDVIAKALGVSQVQVSKLLRTLHDAHEIHIGAWRTGAIGPLTRQYAWGNAPDAEKPKDWPSNYRQPKGVHGCKPGHKRALDLIKKQRLTALQIAEQLPCSKTHAWRIVRDLQTEGKAFIVGYERQPKGVPLALFSDTPPDRAVHRPKPLTLQQRHRKMRRKLSDHFGAEVADAVVGSMFHSRPVSKVVIEGNVIYERGRGLLVDINKMERAA